MKKLISVLLLVSMFVSMISATGIMVFAANEQPELTGIKWNTGFVGSRVNKDYKNQISASSSSFKYSDVITIPKAGTKISFTIKASSYTNDNYYAFSEWKQSGSAWIIDLTGTNCVYIAQGSYITQSYDASKGMTYSYITDHDNQNIRICVPADQSASLKIYQEATTEASTKQQLSDNEFTATLASNGKITGLKWYCGYASSEINTNGTAKEVRYISKNYAFTNLFKVPKAGTKITFTCTANTSNSNYNAFTRYTLKDGIYVYDIGFPANSPQVNTNYTYTYITQNDNEVLRISSRSNLNPTTFSINEFFSVSWEQTNLPGTAANSTTWPDPVIIDPMTGATLYGKEVEGLKWENGYIGSQYNGSSQWVHTSPQNQFYYTSNVFTVPKAGTTVYFFDQSFTDFDDGQYPSTSVLTLSHWKQEGSTWIIDKTKPYFTGCDIFQMDLSSDYRLFRYTTTEDNENIRLCMRYAPVLSYEKALIPPVYLVEATNFEVQTPSGGGAGTISNGKLFDANYTDVNGKNIAYKYYLPYGNGTPEGQYSIVFDNSPDGTVADYLAKKLAKNAIVVHYDGPVDDAMRLLSEFVDHYPVKVSDIFLVGGNDLAAHAQKFVDIRLAQAFLYTGTDKVPAIDYSEVKALSSFADMDAAAQWLLGESDDYYDVLEGLTLYAIGDSYFGGSGIGQHKTWVNILGREYGMKFHNYGMGGNTVATSTHVTNKNQPAMCTRYKELPTDGDIYLLEGGRNDRNYWVPFGENTSYNGSTFKGALNIMIKYIREKAPDAIIILVTPWTCKNELSTAQKKYYGDNDAYANAMRELADHYNDPHILCMYAADKNFSGIDMADARNRKLYSSSPSDVSHLNVNGMYMVAPKFEAWIAEQYAKFTNQELINDASAELFFEPVSEGDAPTNDSGIADSSEAVSANAAPSKGGCGSSAVYSSLALCLGVIGVMFSKRSSKKEDN